MVVRVLWAGLRVASIQSASSTPWESVKSVSMRTADVAPEMRVTTVGCQRPMVPSGRREEVGIAGAL